MGKIKLASGLRSRRGGAKGGNIPGISGDGSLVSAVGSVLGEGSWNPYVPPPEGFTAETGFSISAGPYVDGATVTITRSSGTFGAKAAQNPYYFQTFEGITLETSPPQDGKWLGGTSDTLKVRSDRAYHGSRSLWINTLGNSMASPRVGNMNTSEAYVSARSYMIENAWAASASTDSPNLKRHLLSGSNSSHGTPPDIYYNSFGVSNPASGNGALSGSIEAGLWGDGIRPSATFPAAGYANRTIWYLGIIENAWERIETHFKQSAYNVYDGAFWQKRNGTSAGGGGHAMNSVSDTFAYTSYQCDPYLTHATPIAESARINCYWLPFFTRSYMDIDFWIDELYIDTGQNAQARLELAPSAGFGTDSRPRNPCPYSAWATDSITVTLNAGPNAIAGRGLYFVSGAGAVEKIGEFS